MLEEKILHDYQFALKTGDNLKVSVLRFLRSLLINTAIEKRKKQLDDAEVITVIRKQINKISEAIEEYKKAKRFDLVEKESKELEILKVYLPPPISEEELFKIIDETIDSLGASGPKDMGLVMKEVTEKLQGRADMKMISELVKKRLFFKD